MQRSYAILLPLLGVSGCLELGGMGDINSVTQFTNINIQGLLGSAVGVGTTTGGTNSFQPACGPSSAPDAVYVWTAPATATYVFSTSGSSLDTVLDVRLLSTGVSLGCNDDSNSTLQSTVTANLTAGTTVMIDVDGFGGTSGAYQLSIGRRTGIPSADLYLWLRADLGVVAPAQPGLASQWVDQSGQGRNASMDTLSRQPTLVGGALNGLPVLRFNGAQSLNLDVASQPVAFTAFVVGKNSRPTETPSPILGPVVGSPNHQLRWENGQDVLFLAQNSQSRTSRIGNTRIYHSVAVRYDGVSLMNFYRNGSLVTSTTIPGAGPWSISAVGAVAASQFLMGDIAEIIIYTRVLSDAERTAIESYLLTKYNYSMDVGVPCGCGSPAS